MVHKNIVILGWVQGVGFRYAARKAAFQYGITGFIRNLPDGSVYIEAEGLETPVNEFIAWCHRGPARAQVDSVSVKEAPLRNFREFLITG
jgi:acylphosphatase